MAKEIEKMFPSDKYELREDIYPMFLVESFTAFLKKRFNDLEEQDDLLSFYLYLVRSNLRKTGFDKKLDEKYLFESDFIVPLNKCDLYMKTIRLFQNLHPIRIVDIEGQKRTASFRFSYLGLRPNADGYILLDEKKNFLEEHEYDSKFFEYNAVEPTNNVIKKSEEEDYTMQKKAYSAFSMTRNDSAHEAETTSVKNFFHIFIDQHMNEELVVRRKGSTPSFLLPAEFPTSNEYLTKIINTNSHLPKEKQDNRYRLAMMLSNTEKKNDKGGPKQGSGLGYEDGDEESQKNQPVQNRQTQSHKSLHYPISCEAYLIYNIGNAFSHLFGELFDFFSKSKFLWAMLVGDSLENIRWNRKEGREDLQHNCLTYLKQCGGPFGLNISKCSRKNVEFFSMMWIMLMLSMGAQEEFEGQPTNNAGGNKGLKLLKDLMKKTTMPDSVKLLFQKQSDFPDLLPNSLKRNDLDLDMPTVSARGFIVQFSFFPFFNFVDCIRRLP